MLENRIAQSFPQNMQSRWRKRRRRKTAIKHPKKSQTYAWLACLVHKLFGSKTWTKLLSHTFYRLLSSYLLLFPATASTTTTKTPGQYNSSTIGECARERLVVISICSFHMHHECNDMFYWVRDKHKKCVTFFSIFLFSTALCTNCFRMISVLFLSMLFLMRFCALEFPHMLLLWWWWWCVLCVVFQNMLFYCCLLGIISLRLKLSYVTKWKCKAFLCSVFYGKNGKNPKTL